MSNQEHLDYLLNHINEYAGQFEDHLPYAVAIQVACKLAPEEAKQDIITSLLMCLKHMDDNE